jgi:quercetin dioxygenase-like cupin family protein
MSPMPGPHDHAHEEAVFLYSLQALSSDEAAAVAARIAECAGCRQEMETLRPVMDSFVSWPTDVLRPSRPLWGRLAQRIGAETAAEPASPSRRRTPDPEWQEVAPGISCKVLATDTENDRVTLVVRLAPGTDYPPHRHAGVEELYLLSGELMIGDRKLYPGDYNEAEPGTVDHRVWTETGCTCVLLTSPRDILI